jgi:hypothetical protein
VDELHERPRERFALGVAENPLDGRIHALPVTVEPREDDHLRREREVPLDLTHRTLTPLRRDGERACDGGQNQPAGKHEHSVAWGFDPRHRERTGDHGNHEQHRRYESQTHVDPPRAQGSLCSS